MVILFIKNRGFNLAVRGPFLAIFWKFFQKILKNGGSPWGKGPPFWPLFDPDPVSRRLFSAWGQKSRVGSGVRRKGARDGVFGILGDFCHSFSRFLKSGAKFWVFGFFEFLAKKFVKQKLFCYPFAKNPKAVYGITFKGPQTTPLLFGQKPAFGQKGTIASRSLAKFFGHWTDGLFDFWPKSGGLVWQLFGPNS